MELPLATVAFVVAVVALTLVLRLRNQVAQLPRGDASADQERLRQDWAADLERVRSQSSAELEPLRQELITTRHDLDHAQRELEELKAATQVVPAPPLPRARSVGLSDLREQLRQAHREPEPGSEE